VWELTGGDIIAAPTLFLMSAWSHISIGRDRSNRLDVARCLRCGQMIAAGIDRKTVEIAANTHSCERRPPSGNSEKTNFSDRK
jgi:hypothetical protein